MGKYTFNSESFLKAVFVLLCASSLSLAAPADADKYQDAVAKAFPGFHILTRSEFDPEIQKMVEGNPALITGRFNDDDLEDFAALIRGDVKRKSRSGKDYYRGMEVVCHAGDEQRYACQTLGQGSFFLPLKEYLHRVGPGNIRCSKDDGTETDVKVKRDAIGSSMVGTNGGAVQIYTTNGTYLRCTWD